MHRLIWAFVGRTYLIVGYLMHWLINHFNQLVKITSIIFLIYLTHVLAFISKNLREFVYVRPLLDYVNYVSPGQGQETLFSLCPGLSVCLSVTNCVESCERNSFYSFSRILLKLCRCFCQGLKICMRFGCYPQINLSLFSQFEL